MQDDLIQKIREMHQYCTPEGIATALKIPLEAVYTVLEGKPLKIENRQVGEKPIILVKAAASSHPQKCIAIIRAKGGIGASTLAVHLANTISGKLNVLLIDLNPNGGDTKQYVLDKGLHLGQTGSLVAIRLTDNFYFHYPQPGEVKDSIKKAKENFDAIILDLPNAELKNLQEITQYCNTGIILLDTTLQGIGKLLSWHQMTALRSKFVVVNNGRQIETNEKILQELVQQFSDYDIEEGIYLPFSPELTDAFNRGDFVSRRSHYQEGVSSLVEAILPGLLNSKKSDTLFTKISRLFGGD
ncbi:Cellulose biosynthesis protein BcsQ [Desulforamulus putei DSM 12395]|uniref:Cellulose biosynthesis protein BcsQ n=1 Tax=Desulforamulus putei DSM 12395 TaxID=1121429 RepID=A0A1M4ZGA3_9FIRM|nr:Cellulose biosynthesis protein BcsQ [Desulforamulus putei DSM 12395]